MVDATRVEYRGHEPTAADPNTGRGYSVTGFFIIIRWNITGGFEYVAA
ncbi:MAG: hypothetical protein KAV00_07705 [Phycisphaerae bacterium]|nr:hypothetical protein [Phycisphaerae bacterium]